MSRPPWWAARTLAERREDPRSGPGDAARAGRWATALGGPDALAARLADAGLRADELAAVLGGDGPGADAAAPDWWRCAEETLDPDGRSPIGERGDAEDADVVRGTLRLVAPFARRAHRAWKAHPTGGDAAARALTDGLAAELVELARPTVAAELVATAAVGGWSPADPGRAAAVLRALGDGARARELLAEHPGLARILATRTRLAVAAGLELLDRVHADRARVREELLGGADPGALVGVAASGDAHDGGRRVAVLTFASGARAVLKPRAMRADAAYQGVLAALNARGFAPAFRVLPTIECGPGHGWQAFAAAGGCATEDEVDAYFRRLGGQLAVLHALRATDLHQENVLACGADPVVVDLETVLHPRLGGERAAHVDPAIAETGLDCVLRVGLLPRRDVAFGVDIGGLGRDPAGAVEVADRAWAGARVEERRVRLEPGANAVRLRGEPVRPHEHVEALAAGFARAHDLLVEHREALLAPGGALAAFDGAPLRAVLRPTKVYADLLRAQTEDLAAVDDGLVREERLNVLWRGGARRPELAAAAGAERDDLWDGDVPRIGVRAGSADGHHHRRGVLSGLLAPHAAPGPGTVRRLDARDRERALAHLRASVRAAAAQPDAGAAPGDPDAPPADGTPAGAAVAAGRRLTALALAEDGRAGWLALAPDGRTLRAADASLDAGQAGIVLALARLAAARPGDGLGALATAATRQLRWLRGDAASGDVAALALGPAAAASDGLLAAVAAAAGAGTSPPPVAAPLTAAVALARTAAAGHPRPGALRAAALRLALAAADAPPVARALVLALLVPPADAPGDDVAAAALGAARAAIPADDPAASTARRLERLVALGAAGAGAAPAGPTTFPRGVEVPGLREGLAGCALGWLALAGDAGARADLAAAAALRAEPPAA